MFWITMMAAVGLGVAGAATHDDRLLWAAVALICLVMIRALSSLVQGHEQ